MIYDFLIDEIKVKYGNQEFIGSEEVPLREDIVEEEPDQEESVEEKLVESDENKKQLAGSASSSKKIKK